MFWAVSAPCLPAEVSTACHNCVTTLPGPLVTSLQCGQQSVVFIYLFILLQTWETAKCYVLLNVEEGTNKSTDKLFLYRHQCWLRVPEPRMCPAN